MKIKVTCSPAKLYCDSVCEQRTTHHRSPEDYVHSICASAFTLLAITLNTSSHLKAQQPACAGNACPMVTISHASGSLMSAPAAATQRTASASRAVASQAAPSTGSPKLLVIGTQIQNRSTTAMTVTYSPATNITLGKPATCGSPTSFQLAAGQTQSVSGFLCSPSQVSDVAQSQ
jgi:hypothetical protein